MADDPDDDFEKPVNAGRLERMAAEQGDASPSMGPTPPSSEGEPSLPRAILATPEESSSAPTSSPRHMLEAWLAGMVESKASDLILRAGARPSRRVAGKIQFLPGRVPGPGPLLEVLEGVMGERRMSIWRDTGSADAALHLDGLGRFRLNVYKQMGEPAVVIRRINEEAPDIAELGLPMGPLRNLAMRKRGLILVTGIAGSGKSTTLAGMIQHMNRTIERHVITLEDPVELIFQEERCVISQREVGTDCMDFEDGLRHALRQSPDVLLIGEMRDAETVISALDATETGHLVMSTLHTVNAPQTVDRILSFFPSEQHAQIRSRLADNLAGVLSQRLLPRAVEPGLVPAFELLVPTPHVRELLQEGQTGELARVIEQGTEEGLISFNQCLRELVVDHRVNLQDALAASDRPDDLVLALRGITASHGRPQRPSSEAPGPRSSSPHDDDSPGLRMAGG
jgi:pilus retraction protein PilT